MSDLPSIISAIGGVITAIGVILIAFWSYRAKERVADAVKQGKLNEAQIIAVGDTIYALGEKVDGRLTDLLRESKAASRAEGVAAGEQSQRDRHAASEDPTSPYEVTVVNDPTAPVPTKSVGDK